jgi:acyl-CoA synthetase (AMP-forming)/AMP-acid ligase II
VSVGPPVPGVAVEVRDADGGAADSEGVEGRIFVRGPSVATEYLGRDGAPLDLGGWLDTGDLGFLLGGELYVTGRVKDIIIRAGAKFRPHDIERVVAEVLDLRPDRVAAFADASARDREAVVVVAEVAAIEERVAAKVRAAVAREVGVAIDVLRAVRVGAIPKTTSGKTIRARCGELRHDAR